MPQACKLCFYTMFKSECSIMTELTCSVSIAYPSLPLTQGDYLLTYICLQNDKYSSSVFDKTLVSPCSDCLTLPSALGQSYYTSGIQHLPKAAEMLPVLYNLWFVSSSGTILGTITVFHYYNQCEYNVFYNCKKHITDIKYAVSTLL